MSTLKYTFTNRNRFIGLHDEIVYTVDVTVNVVVCYDLPIIPVTLNGNKQVKLMTFCLHFCSSVP